MHTRRMLNKKHVQVPGFTRMPACFSCIGADEGHDTKSDEHMAWLPLLPVLEPRGTAGYGCRHSSAHTPHCHTGHACTDAWHAKDTTGISGAPHLFGSGDEVHQVQCALNVGHVELLTAHQLGAGWRVADLQSQTSTGRIASPQCTLPSACTLQARSLLA